ncbi:methylmalonyl Co-A mutase-associated GTPase MeaB [Natronobacterium gregoryi]|uniref:LAO/AO transport system ATPase n=2 Tax=Natronobacterium gregoryi TaxID=44930 RepID=L0AFZ3_NATGS|nr:methylmalonyl Co-A mutase-associated GTPase MeaB [Natronobacterium gregoryi]AFZ72067.1 LAO/AO transport system ATPase [Natronobacterium gregoryi SP2]ELY62760.1 LAO/AO transporter ATPase [Natronobacterium gregoryi SP2]PLK20041.1 methylmalonyl Co-A mutase-associated GTPase MeaB [Natronobacterium gregoryi SP2]SFJ44584.1 LAO/AO transport system kinase [Natronobacterium gregoryi]
MNADDERLLEDLLEGKHRALARVISKIEDRAPGYRDLVSELYAHTGEADVIGITGSPGAGKSTLVDKLAETYRERDETVGIIAIDPSSPFSGGAVLGDRIRMGSTIGDMDVFVRSMSARGTLGGLSTATTDAVKAMDAFGKDKIIIETVGAGQNEIDIVRTADTVAVLVPPGSGDDVQTLKAGILEIADVFVVNKADRDGADRTVHELQDMVAMGAGDGVSMAGGGGHHGADALATMDDHDDAHAEWAEDADADADADEWVPPIVETVATRAEGVEEFIGELETHQSYLIDSGTRAEMARKRYAEEIRTLLREDVHDLLEDELAAAGGIDDLAENVRTGETSPYSIADELLAPVADCLDELETGE